MTSSSSAVLKPEIRNVLRSEVRSVLLLVGPSDHQYRAKRKTEKSVKGNQTGGPARSEVGSTSSSKWASVSAVEGRAESSRRSRTDLRNASWLVGVQSGKAEGVGDGTK